MTPFAQILVRGEWLFAFYVKADVIYASEEQCGQGNFPVRLTEVDKIIHIVP